MPIQQVKVRILEFAGSTNVFKETDVRDLYISGDVSDEKILGFLKKDSNYWKVIRVRGECFVLDKCSEPNLDRYRLVEARLLRKKSNDVYEKVRSITLHWFQDTYEQYRDGVVRNICNLSGNSGPKISTEEIGDDNIFYICMD